MASNLKLAIFLLTFKVISCAVNGMQPYSQGMSTTSGYSAYNYLAPANNPTQHGQTPKLKETKGERRRKRHLAELGQVRMESPFEEDYISFNTLNKPHLHLNIDGPTSLPPNGAGYYNGRPQMTERTAYRPSFGLDYLSSKSIPLVSDSKKAASDTFSFFEKTTPSDAFGTQNTMPSRPSTPTAGYELYAPAPAYAQRYTPTARPDDRNTFAEAIRSRPASIIQQYTPTRTEPEPAFNFFNSVPTAAPLNLNKPRPPPLSLSHSNTASAGHRITNDGHKHQIFKCRKFTAPTPRLPIQSDEMLPRIKEAVFNIITRAHHFEHMMGPEFSLEPFDIGSQDTALNVDSILEDLKEVRSQLSERQRAEKKSLLALDLDDSCNGCITSQLMEMFTVVQNNRSPTTNELTRQNLLIDLRNLVETAVIIITDQPESKQSNTMGRFAKATNTNDLRDDICNVRELFQVLISFISNLKCFHEKCSSHVLKEIIIYIKMAEDFISIMNLTLLMTPQEIKNLDDLLEAVYEHAWPLFQQQFNHLQKLQCNVKHCHLDRVDIDVYLTAIEHFLADEGDHAFIIQNSKSEQKWNLAEKDKKKWRKVKSQLNNLWMYAELPAEHELSLRLQESLKYINVLL